MSSRPQSQSDVAPPLPQNVDAERSILGAILLDNKYLPVAVEKIAPEDFFHHHHRLIFYCMLEMAKQAVPIELVTIHDALAKEGELEAAGGVPYISALMDGIPSQANVEHYARIVREKSILRDMIHAASAIQQQSFEACEDPGAILEHARKLFADIKADVGTDKAPVRAHKPAELLENADLDYFAYPVAVRGLVTLLDGAAKAAGKSTLLLTSIAALLRGNLFLNRATKPVRILYVTEEYPTTFRIALARAGLLDGDFHYLTAADLGGKTWEEKLAIIEENCVALKTDWLIVDTFFAVCAIGSELENDAGSVDAAVTPLRNIVGRLDMALTLTRHTRKSGGTIGESGRGSSALTGAADTILELKRLPGSPLYPERRNLEVTGRVESAFLEIELRDGQYIIAPDPEVDNSVPEADRLATAISQNPSATFRDLEELTGISRSRLSRVAASKGWHKEGDLWVLS